MHGTLRRAHNYLLWRRWLLGGAHDLPYIRVDQLVPLNFRNCIPSVQCLIEVFLQYDLPLDPFTLFGEVAEKLLVIL